MLAVSPSHPSVRLLTFQKDPQAAVGEAERGGEALQGGLLLVPPVAHLQRLQCPVQVSACEEEAGPRQRGE